jgi:hypothetical protein
MRSCRDPTSTSSNLSRALVLGTPRNGCRRGGRRSLRRSRTVDSLGSSRSTLSGRGWKFRIGKWSKHDRRDIPVSPRWSNHKRTPYPLCRHSSKTHCICSTATDFLKHRPGSRSHQRRTHVTNTHPNGIIKSWRTRNHRETSPTGNDGFTHCSVL